MKYKLLKELYEKRNLENELESAISSVNALKSYLLKKNSSLKDCTLGELESYLDILIQGKKNDINTLLAMARYFYTSKQDELYIYFTGILGGIGVIENIQKRSSEIAGDKKTNEIFKISPLPLGTPINKTPVFTKELMESLAEHLEPKVYQKILAGNNHNIPVESMLEEKNHFESSESLETYLKERHARRVKELQEFCDENKIWYEQKITQEIVDFVKENQEILSAKLDDNKLYITKFPYNPEKFLRSTDSKEKRYQYCHCSFARECIKDEKINIPSDWCYCSAGYAKFPFEVLLGRELDVEVLESVLGGDERCRFVIDLSEPRILIKSCCQ